MLLRISLVATCLASIACPGSSLTSPCDSDEDCAADRAGLTTCACVANNSTDLTTCDERGGACVKSSPCGADDLFCVVLKSDQISDLDMHLVQLPGSFCGVTDCHGGDCELDWGSAGADDDPTFTASGAEKKIVVPRLAAFKYSVSVSNAASAGADATLIIHPQEVPESTDAISIAAGSMLEWGTIDGGGGDCTLGRVDDDWTCAETTPAADACTF